MDWDEYLKQRGLRAYLRARYGVGAYEFGTETLGQEECKHCHRMLTYEGDGMWVDPNATGDDAMWRETCDMNDTFTAYHETFSQCDLGDEGQDHKSYTDDQDHESYVPLVSAEEEQEALDVLYSTTEACPMCGTVHPV